MEKVKGRFIDDLSRHFSLQTDLRVYEDCKVTLPDGKVSLIYISDCYKRLLFQGT